MKKSGKLGDSVLQTGRAKVLEYMFLQKLMFELFLEISYHSKWVANHRHYIMRYFEIKDVNPEVQLRENIVLKRILVRPYSFKKDIFS